MFTVPHFKILKVIALIEEQYAYLYTAIMKVAMRSSKQASEKHKVENEKLRLLKTKKKKVNKKIFNCNLCFKTFKKSNFLKIHQRVHVDLKLYNCLLCNKDFNTIFSLKTHNKIHSKKETVECDHCNKELSSKNALINHLRVHTGEKPFTCNICSKTFANSANHRKHVLIHSCLKPHECDICKKKFSRKDHLISHFRIHTGERPFQCRFCTQTFRFLANFKKHEKMHSDVRPHECSVCKKKFFTITELKYHLKKHINKQLNECDSCSKSFKFLSGLQKHKTIHAGANFFNCCECKKIFNSKVKLMNHIKKQCKIIRNKNVSKVCISSKKDGKNIKSTLKIKNEKIIKNKKKLKNNKILKVKDEKTQICNPDEFYKCDSCEKIFYQKTSMIAHFKCHLNISCDVCGIKFTKKKRLNYHLRIHNKKSTLSNINKPDSKDNLVHTVNTVNPDIKKEILEELNLSNFEIDQKINIINQEGDNEQLEHSSITTTSDVEFIDTSVMKDLKSEIHVKIEDTKSESTHRSTKAWRMNKVYENLQNTDYINDNKHLTEINQGLDNILEIPGKEHILEKHNENANDSPVFSYHCICRKPNCNCIYENSQNVMIDSEDNGEYNFYAITSSSYNIYENSRNLIDSEDNQEFNFSDTTEGTHINSVNEISQNIIINSEDNGEYSFLETTLSDSSIKENTQKLINSEINFSEKFDSNMTLQEGITYNFKSNTNSTMNFNNTKNLVTYKNKSTKKCENNFELVQSSKNDFESTQGFENNSELMMKLNEINLDEGYIVLIEDSEVCYIALADIYEIINSSIPS